MLIFTQKTMWIVYKWLTCFEIIIVPKGSKLNPTLFSFHYPGDLEKATIKHFKHTWVIWKEENGNISSIKLVSLANRFKIRPGKKIHQNK